MITRVSSIPAMTWPSWEDVEVVDSVLVEEPPQVARPRSAALEPGPGAYDRFGRMPDAGRFGRLVSVLASRARPRGGARGRPAPAARDGRAPCRCLRPLRCPRRCRPGRAPAAGGRGG